MTITKKGFVASVLAGASVGTLIGFGTQDGDAQQRTDTTTTTIKVKRPGPGEVHRIEIPAQPVRPKPALFEARYKASRRVTLEPGIRVSDSLLRAFGFEPVGAGLPRGAQVPIVTPRPVYVEPKDTLLLAWKPRE